MNSLNELSFNYQKVVNNLPNKVSKFNKMLTSLHKMKHTRYASLCEEFYSKHYEFLQNFAEQSFASEQADLELYCKWLGNNGERN